MIVYYYGRSNQLTIRLQQYLAVAYHVHEGQSRKVGGDSRQDDADDQCDFDRYGIGFVTKVSHSCTDESSIEIHYLALFMADTEDLESSVVSVVHTSLSENTNLCFSCRTRQFRHD
jgi:hypothetical protein